MTSMFHYFKTTVQGTYLGQSWENVWWHTIQSPTDGSDLSQEVAQEVWDTYTELEPVLVDGCTITQVESINWYTGTEVGTVTGSLVGDVSSAGMPSWVCYTVSWSRTAVGRNYPMKRIPGVPEAATTGNDLVSTYRDALLDFGESMRVLELPSGYNFLMFVVGENPPLLTFDLVASPYRIMYPPSVRDAKLGTQKTRKP